MFQIMTAVTGRGTDEKMYKFLTTTTDGETKNVELADRAALDVKVEKMLNEEGYSKDDFIIVQVTDYTIDAKNYGGGN